MCRLAIPAWGARSMTVVRELQDFRVSYSTAGNAIFSAREGTQDDLVLTASLAIFDAAHPIPNSALMPLHI